MPKLYQSNQPNFSQDDWGWAKQNINKKPSNVSPAQQAALAALQGTNPGQGAKWTGDSWNKETVGPTGARYTSLSSTPSIAAFDPTAVATDKINQATLGFGDDIGADPTLQAAQDFQSGVLSGGNLPYSERAMQGMKNRYGDSTAAASAHAADMLREQLAQTGVTSGDPSAMAALRSIETNRMQQNLGYQGDLENTAATANFGAQTNASNTLAQQKLAQLAQQGNAYSQGAHYLNQTQSGGDHVAAGYQGPPKIGNLGGSGQTNAQPWTPPVQAAPAAAAAPRPPKPAAAPAAPAKWTMPQSTMGGGWSQAPAYQGAGPVQDTGAYGAGGWSTAPAPISFQNMEAGLPKPAGIVRPSQGGQNQYALSQLNARLRN